MRSRVVFRTSTILSLVASVTSTAFTAQAEPPAASAASAPAARGRPMRVAECVEVALRSNVDVQTASEDVAVSESQRAGARGMIGPKLRVDAYVHEWNSDYTIPFALDPTQPAVPFPVRNQFEWNATVTLTQPITGLFAIFDAYKVRSLGVDIANIRREVARRETAFRVVESYYRLVQADKLVEVANASVEQLQAQLKQSNSFHANGVVSQDDVLRAELAVAGAQQRLIQARSRVALEQTRLRVVMGLPPEAVVDAQPIANPSFDNEALSLDQVEKAGQSQRIELVELDKRIEQASSEVNVARLKLIPQVSAEGAYIHNEGSQFVQLNAGYIGARASWDVWDWGTNASGISEAKARARQAEIARTKVADQIRLEVTRAFLDLTAAGEAMAVAQASVASAEENFRLVKKRYDASAATSFDVIDAEGLLTQARGQMQTALYDRVIARAALRRATGLTPDKIAHE